MKSRVHELFAAEVARRSPAELIDFLLDAAPTYGRVMAGDPLTSELDVQEHIGTFDDEPKHSLNPPPHMSPFGCPFCKHCYVCVDTELACLVCMQCGRQGPVGFEHSYRPLGDVPPPQTYQYKPVHYLLKHLAHLQGERYPTIEPHVISSLKRDLMDHGTMFHTAEPNVVYESLKRLNLPR